MEPYINRDVRRVLKVPDKVIHSYEFSTAVAAESMEPGHCIYTAFLNDEASIIDDTIIYKINEKKYFRCFYTAGSVSLNNPVPKSLFIFNIALESQYTNFHRQVCDSELN